MSHRALRRQIEAEFFRGAAVSLRWDISQRVEKGIVQLGGAAGPRSTLAGLCHEMAHLVEIDDARCATVGWGLRVRRSKSREDPLTTQITQRECRVAAYQATLLDYLDVPFSPRRLIAGFEFLPDYLLVPGRTTEEKAAWCEDFIAALMRLPEYSINAFKAEWWRKQVVLSRLRAGK